MSENGVTADRLLGGRVKILQPDAGYRVSVDAILLAAAVRTGGGDTVLDVGCGDGGATLCLAWREPDVSIHGIDVRRDAVARLRDGAAENGWQDRVSATRYDVGAGATRQMVNGYDTVMSNPPYLPAERMDLRGQGNDINPALTETVPLADWVAFMAACLREGGGLTLVHRADRLPDLLSAMRPHGGGITVYPIWPRVGEPARRVIVSARKGSKAPSRILPGLVLHGPDGSFSDAAAAVLEDGRPLYPE